MIDDDQDDHVILKIALSELEKSFNCLSFIDCEQAIKHFEKPNVDSPAFVFMDLTLPRIDSLDCLLRLQKLSKFDHPCVIIYSGYIPENLHSELKANGVNKFLVKTSSMEDLTQQLKDLLDAS